MRKIKYLAICSVFLILVLVCGGCVSALQNFDNPEIHQSAETMLDALIADDFQTAYSLVSSLCTEDDFKPTFTQMRALLGNTDTYELTLLSIYTNSRISNGEKSTSVSAVYEMTTTSDRIIVSIQTDSRIGLCSFYVTPYNQTDYYSTGGLQNMKGSTGVQWLLLLSNIITLGFTVFALVDCCRHKINRKLLWILLLIFGFVTIGITLSSTSFRLNWNVGWITAYSAWIRYGSGTATIRLMLPVGAICYFIKRRSLLTQPSPAAATDEITLDTPEQECCAEQHHQTLTDDLQKE